MLASTFNAYRDGRQWIATVESPGDVILPAGFDEPGRLFRATMGFGRTKAEAVAESMRLFECVMVLPSRRPTIPHALWHRSRDGKPPRPVLIVQRLACKVRVLDLVDSTPRRLVLREVMPENLTEAPAGLITE